MYSEDKTKKNFDTETKIRLLLALINDEGKEKLANNIKKLINRLAESKDKYFDIIKSTFISTITQIPLKSSIYTYCLFKIFKATNDSVLIEQIITGVIKALKEEKFSDETTPRRIFRFFYECYKYKLFNKAILSFINGKIFDFENYKDEPTVLRNLVYLFTSNVPYLFNSLSEQEERDEILNKLGKAKSMIKKNLEKINPTWNVYRNKGDYNYLDNMIDTFLKLGKENKINSEFLFDLKDFETIDDQPQDNENKEAEASDLENNLSYLHSCILEVFKDNLSNKINLQHLNLSMLTNDYFNFGGELEKINPTILNEDILMSDLDKILINEITEEVMIAFEKDISICFVNYLTKISRFYSYKKNLDFSIINHLMNMIVRSDTDNLRVLGIANVLNRFSLVSSNFSSNKFNLSSTKEITFLIANKYIPESHLVSSSIENFCSFMSFFLSNQEFKYTFEKIDVSPSNPSQRYKIELFKKYLVDRLCALGSLSKIGSYLTEGLRNYLPAENKPFWKFSPNEPFYYDTDVINDNIQYKKEFSSWSEKFESTGSDFIYILFSCLFYTKSKTLSHLRESLLFYKDAINHYITNTDTQIILLNALFDVWGQSDTYLKFLIEFLLNQNFIDHLILIKFIFQKLKTIYLPEMIQMSTIGSINIGDQYLIVKNYFMFCLIDSIIFNCEKSLNRLKADLSREQESLANSDESLQTGIIKSIEFLEENIEKVICANNTIYQETLYLYLDLYFSLGNSEKNINYLPEFIVEEKNFLFEKIVQFSLKNKSKLSENPNSIFGSFSAQDKKIEEFFNSLKYF